MGQSKPGQTRRLLILKIMGAWPLCDMQNCGCVGYAIRDDIETFSISYDYKSMMHYSFKSGKLECARNGRNRKL